MTVAKNESQESSFQSTLTLLTQWDPVPLIHEVILSF